LKQKQISFSASIIVLSLVLAALILPQTLADDQIDKILENKATFLILTFNTANQSVSQTIVSLQTRAITLPQASEIAFKDAQGLANQSLEANQKGDFPQSIFLTTKALQRLKETIITIYDSVEVTSTQQETAHELIIALRDSVDRNQALLQRLENMANSVASHGSSVTTTKEKIATIKADLTSATQNIDAANLNQAKNLLKQAELLISEVTTSFDSLAVTLKTEKVSAFINSSQQRLVTLTQKLNSVSNQLSSSAQVAASAAITQAQESLTAAKQYLNNEQVTQTIDALATVTSNEKTVTDYIKAISPIPTPYLTTTPKPNISTRNTNASVSVSPNTAAIPK
jgi:hypothetical protein